MTIPFVFGWSQLILLIIALVGIFLLINAFVGLRGRRRRYKDDEEDEEHKFRRHRYGRFRLRYGRLLGGAFR